MESLLTVVTCKGIIKEKVLFIDWSYLLMGPADSLRCEGSIYFPSWHLVFFCLFPYLNGNWHITLGTTWLLGSFDCSWPCSLDLLAIKWFEKHMMVYFFCQIFNTVRLIETSETKIMILKQIFFCYFVETLLSYSSPWFLFSF